MAIKENLQLTALNVIYMNSTDTNIAGNQNNTNENDYYDGLYDPPLGLIVLLSIFYGSISFLAVVGNILVMWIIATSKKMQNVTNFYIANLAFADIIIGLFSIPFQFQAALLQRWNLPSILCPFCPFVQTLSVNVSIFTLTAIAVDRHKAIVYPLSARQSKGIAKKIISGIWILGFAFAIPILYALRVKNVFDYIDEAETELVHLKPFCDLENLSPSTMTIYRTVLFFLQYILPVCVISFVYAHMAITLWGSRAPGNAQCSRDANLIKNKKKVIKMLFIVVAIFTICWLPLQTYLILQMYFPIINQFRYINIIFFCFDWLAMSNSCYNPFIYGIYNENFQNEFRRRFSLGIRKRNATGADSTNTHTLSTRLTQKSSRDIFPLIDIRKYRKNKTKGCEMNYRKNETSFNDETSTRVLLISLEHTDLTTFTNSLLLENQNGIVENGESIDIKPVNMEGVSEDTLLCDDRFSCSEHRNDIYTID